MEQGVVTQVLECVKLVVGPESGLSKDQLDAFKARARSLPSMLFTNGLAYTLVYVASRSNYKAVDVGLASESCNDLVSKLKSLLYKAEREEAGYFLYGSLLAYMLKYARLTTAKSFDELVKKAMEDAFLNQGALAIAEWIKRLAEAYIQG